MLNVTASVTANQDSADNINDAHCFPRVANRRRKGALRPRCVERFGMARTLASIDETVVIMLTGLSSLPARCTRDLPLRRAIENPVRALRLEISDARNL